MPAGRGPPPRASRPALIACLVGAALAVSVEAAAARTVTAATVQHAGSDGEFASVTMGDAGTDGDAVAGDGVFTAQVPAYDDELPRYRFTYTLAVEQPDEEVDVGTTPTTLVINELMASNSGTVDDPQGDQDDWIELLNWGTEKIDLSGMYLSDRTSRPLKWQFPDGTSIAPGGYLLVWADDDSGDSPGLHTNFKLAAGGESVVLSDLDARDNVVIDSVDFPALATDVSYGRAPEATGAFGTLEVASPGRSTPVAPEVAISADGPVTEGGTASFTVSAAPPPGDALVVSVAVTQGAGQDYLPSAPPSSVTIPAGAGEASLDVEIPNDQVDEPNGVIKATLAHGDGYVVGSAASASLTVRDDDGTPAAGTIVINELMASNGSTVADPQGEFDDWIELLNMTAAPIDLSGMYLSDSRANPKKWRFPDGTILLAGGRLLVWADDDAEDSPGVHTNFKLAAGGESVVLSDTDDNGNAVIDAVDYPELARNESYARVPEGTGSFQVTSAATPAVLQVTLEADVTSVLEGDAARFTARLSAGEPQALEVGVAVTEDGSFVSGTAPASVTFAAGSTTASLVVATGLDAVVEGNGAVTATLLEGAGYALGSPASATITVADDDTADWNVTATPAEIAEGESATVELAIANGVTFAVTQTLELAVTGDVDASDYTLVPTRLALAAGTSSTAATLAATLDEAVEAPETATLTARIGGEAIGSATVTMKRATAPLTARWDSVPWSHAGADTRVTLRLAFSEAPRIESATLRDEIFEVTGGGVVNARRVDGPNDVWDIEFAVATDEELVVTLPATTDCAAVGAVCTTDGRKLSATLETRVPGLQAAPAVRGVPQVGQWLTADTADERLPGVGYQWHRDGIAIAGATGPAYLLRAADTGAMLTVRVSQGARTATTAATIPIWGAPGSPLVSAGEEELLGTLLTVGSTDADRQSLGGYGRLSQAAFGSLDSTVLRVGAAEHEVTAAVLNDTGMFALGTRPAVGDARGWSVYWDGYRIDGLSLKQSSEGDSWIGQTPQAPTAYGRYLDGSSDGVRVSLSIRRALPVATVAAVGESVDEGSAASFEVALDRAAAAALEIAVEVAVEGDVVSGDLPSAVTVAAGSTTATLAVGTDDDSVVEGAGTVTVTLTSGEGYALGEASSARVTVEDDDVAEWTVTAEPSGIEEGGSATLTVSIGNGVTFAQAQTIGLSVDGEVSASDYTLSPAGLTLAGGATQATATLRAVDDEEEEPSESATVTVSVDGEEVGSATLTVLASDPVSGLWLAAAATLEKIEAIEDGGTLMVGSDTPARTTLLAQAGVSPSAVRLELSGPVAAARSDAEAPYTLHGPGDAMALVPGDYRATVTVIGDEAGEQDSETHSAAFAVRRWARAAGRDISTLEAAGNTDPQGLWGDGETLWVADHLGGRVYAYALADGGRLPEREIDTAASGNARPVGLWSNGETLWAGDSEDGRLYAYALADGERQPDRDVDLGGGSVQDLWGDGATLWVLHGRGVAAYGLDGARQPQRDVALDAVNGWPTGLWSDGARLLVTDVGRRPWLYVYRDGALSPVEGLGLSSGGEFPQVPWSDGQTLWVADDQSATLHSYALEPPSSNATLTLLRLSNVALDAYAPLTTRYAGETVAARTTLTAHGASGARLAITPEDADTAAPGHQVDLAEGANEIRVTVTAADGTTTRTYAVTVTRSAESAAVDARLSALTLRDVAFDGFDSDVYEYWATAGSEVAATVVGATPLQESAVVTVTPEDADARAPGHQVALAEGANEIRVTVTAADETTTRTYAVTVTRAAVPLTARWAALPERHDGTATVRLRVAFSEPVTTGFAALRDHAFEVTNGSLTDARRVDGRSDLRELDVLPASDAELVLVLPVTTDCAAVGAVCTASYKPLSNRLEARIPGRAGPEEPAVAVTLTAAAASVTEGTVARFTATLTEALAGALTVPVTVTSAGEVLDGTPPASVTFEAGDTSAALAVPTDDDSVVEGDGTVTAALTAGEGYALGEASSASVTVEDDDVAAWSVTAEPAGIEEGGSATLTVSIGNGVTYAQAQTIALSVDGEVSASDYTLSAASLALSAGATSATATLTAIDDEASEGPERATVTAHLDGAAIGSAVVTVEDAAPLETPVVSGVVQVGEALTASMDGGQVSTVVKASASGTSAKAMSVKALSAKSAKSASPKSASVTYQWLRDGSEMAGATGLSYVLTSADVGATVSVRVTQGGRTATSAATIPIWAAPWNPPVGADEEELFPALLTVGSTGAYSLPLGGYGRMSKASFGALDDTVLRVDGVAHRVTVAALNNVGQFALGTEPDLDDTRGWSVYWDGHRIDRLSLKRSSEGALWLGEAPTVYERYLRGSSDGVRVALSIRRPLPTPVATLAAVGDSVDEGSGAVFEVTLDRAPAAALEIAVEVGVEGDVVSGEVPSAVTVLAGSTTATLEVSTDDDSVVEEDGSVTATLQEGGGYALGEAVAATVAVADNDVAAWTVTAAPAELVEGGSATLAVSTGTGVTFATERTLELSVTGDVSASDYALEPGTLALEAGTDTATATFEALSDGVEELPEAARLGVALDGTEVAATEMTVRDASAEARLSSLMLTDVDIGEFDAERTAYAATVPAGVSTTTVTADPADANAAVAIADALGSTQGTQRTSSLATGANEIAATVTAEDASTVRTYTVSVTRLPGWGTRLPERDIALAGVEATGVWSDGTTLWAAESDGEAAQAYDLATGARRSADDIALTAKRYVTTALWSEDGTLWVANALGEAVAYRLSDGARVASADLDGMLSSAGNGEPVGLWSDGSVLYVVDRADKHLYAYASDGERLPDREYGLDREERSRAQWGLWSDGETLLTSGSSGYVVAYRLSDGARLLDRDIDLGMIGYGLWSDGETLWVADSLLPRVLAYAVPGLRRASGSGLLPVVVTNRAVGVPSSDPGAPVAVADAGLRGRIAAALGKAPEAGVGVDELLALQSLDARGAGIADLTGLEYAANVTALDLSHNPLADLRELGSLPRLAVLNLDATGAQPWALAGLTGLERLSLRGNGIEDVTALAGLDRLRALDLGGNAIEDAGPLAGLDALEVLDLGDNRIGDLSTLVGLRAKVELRGNRSASVRETDAGGAP